MQVMINTKPKHIKVFLNLKFEATQWWKIPRRINIYFRPKYASKEGGKKKNPNAKEKKN